jgi:hypothetical protein
VNIPNILEGSNTKHRLSLLLLLPLQVHAAGQRPRSSQVCGQLAKPKHNTPLPALLLLLLMLPLLQVHATGQLPWSGPV